MKTPLKRNGGEHLDRNLDSEISPNIYLYG